MRVIGLPTDDGGCGWYRIRQPFLELNKLPDWNTYVINPARDDMTAVADAMRVADLLVARPGGEQGVQKILDEPEYKGKPWVMDIDDNLLDISPYSPHYEDYGVKDFYDRGTKQWIWKDGVNLKAKINQQKRDWHVWGLKNATLVTTSTERLRKFALRYNKNVVVTPNCINFKKWWKLDTKPHKKLRVGWSGGISHYEDWYSIKEPLNELMRELQFTLVMVGSNFEGIVDPDNRHLVEVHDWVPFEGHSYRMMAMDLDLAIIPLADLPFNKTKSSVKFYEFSAMGVPSVVSWVPPYSDDVPETACLRYSNHKQFKEAILEALVGSQARKTREKLAKQANEWVKDHQDSKKNVNIWVDAYKKAAGVD